jgi:hypothetical protein
MERVTPDSLSAHLRHENAESAKFDTVIGCQGLREPVYNKTDHPFALAQRQEQVRRQIIGQIIASVIAATTAH